MAWRRSQVDAGRRRDAVKAWQSLNSQVGGSFSCAQKIVQTEDNSNNDN